MGWFNKKEKESKKKEAPLLSELPKLPEFPKIEGEKIDSTIPQLPSFPTNSLGEKFSQDTIKEAVTGKKEGEEIFKADDFAQKEYETQMMQKSLKKPLTKELSYSEKEERKIPLRRRIEEIPEEFKEVARVVKKSEPIFIRIDKFEESLHIFEKAKKQILEIEKMLKNTKRIEEEERKELEFWEKEIQTIKKQIEKIDRDLFSKIE